MKFEVISVKTVDELKKALEDFRRKNVEAKYLGMTQNLTIVSHQFPNHTTTTNPIILTTICYE